MRAPLHLHMANSPWLSSLMPCLFSPPTMHCAVVMSVSAGCPSELHQRERRVKGSGRELWRGISICCGNGMERVRFSRPQTLQGLKWAKQICLLDFSTSFPPKWHSFFFFFVEQWDLIIFLPPHCVWEKPSVISARLN